MNSYGHISTATENRYIREYKEKIENDKRRRRMDSVCYIIRQTNKVSDEIQNDEDNNLSEKLLSSEETESSVSKSQKKTRKFGLTML